MRSNSTGGYIEFGSIPKDAYRGDLTEVKVIQKPEGDKLSQNYDSWRVYTPQYKVGNGSLKDAHAGSGKNTGTAPCKYASLDTGVTALRLNKAIVDDYHKGLPDAKYSEAFEAHVVPCNTTLPDLGLALDVNGKNDSKVFTVPGNKLKMAMQPLPEYWETKTRYERDAIMEADRKNGIQYNKTGEFCLTGLQYINEEAPKGMCTQMWGAPFFTSVFTVLDFGKKTVKLGEYA
ncbi:hypothetical protein KEM55_004680 [Ascosphaera atra]|nr:hypothetical protein KEM55_004680 [Ascosphaera atra]